MSGSTFKATVTSRNIIKYLCQGFFDSREGTALPVTLWQMRADATVEATTCSNESMIILSFSLRIDRLRYQLASALAAGFDKYKIPMGNSSGTTDILRVLYNHLSQHPDQRSDLRVMYKVTQSVEHGTPSVLK